MVCIILYTTLFRSTVEDYAENGMQEIGGALKHLTMAAGAKRDIYTKLTEAVEQLTKNNASLTTQLSNAMKLNLDMANKLNLKATQGQDPEVKIMVEKERRKAIFERKLEPDGYCWTHGFRVTNKNSSQTCSTPAAGHQRTESRKNIMGGSEAGK